MKRCMLIISVFFLDTKMKKIILSSLIFLLVCCTAMIYGTRYNYNFELLNNNSQDMSWEDNKISIFFSISDKSIDFKLTNNTESVMKIIWDEASMVMFGEAKKVMHTGIKYIDRNSAQTPTIIPPNSSIDDCVLPTENVYWRKGYYGKYSSSAGGWEENDLFPIADMNNNDTKQLIMNLNGTTFSIYLPIHYQNTTLDYTFKFKISNVSPVSSNNDYNASNELTSKPSDNNSSYNLDNLIESVIKISNVKGNYVLFESSINYKIGDIFNIQRIENNKIIKIGKIEVLKKSGNKIGCKIINEINNYKIKIGDEVIQ